MNEPRTKSDLDVRGASDFWAMLRRFTPARIGLGRVGGSLPTRAMLDFELAHAWARDAVHAEFNAKTLVDELREAGFGEPVVMSSQARDRKEYLLRPDLGRTLDAKSQETLRNSRRDHCALAVVIADGLSAMAPMRHAVPLLCRLRDTTSDQKRGAVAGWPLARLAVIVANHARVALGDEIGGLLGAEAVVVLIGERPGLSSPDSLGVYITWAPRAGRTDAERNCISNVRPEGLTYPEAASRLAYLLGEVRRLNLSGVGLKDDSEGRSKNLSGSETPG